MKSPNQNKFFIINLIIVLVFSSAYIETEDELENVFSVHDQSLLSCLLYTSPSPRDRQKSRMPSSA